MKNKKFTASFLIGCADLHHINFISDSYINSAKLIIEKGDKSSSAHSQTFHLLTTIIFELIPKILIISNVCIKYKSDHKITEEDLRREIIKELKKYGHNIKKLFEKFPDLTSYLEIESIVKLPNNTKKDWFINEYRFKIKNNPFEISIKDLEAVRYGSFSEDRDVALDCTQDENIMFLILKLQTYTQNIINNTIEELRQSML